MKNLLAFYSKLLAILLIGVYGSANAQNISVSNKDKTAVKNYKTLIKQADSLLNVNGFSVVNKTGIPPSKSKHDYMSIGPYWWPNPNTANGLPYIRKDGEINPETRSNFTDYIEKKNFIVSVVTLTNAYLQSNKKKYALKNLELIRTWFLDSATKMNPNLNYGQYVPGKSKGRCFGIIEFRDVVEVIKFLELVEEKHLLDKKTKQGMFSWFSIYVKWLQNSELGKEAATRKNNHGTHYDAQLLDILIYLNRIEEVKKHLLSITETRIFNQIEPDGSQPLELARTKSFSYAVMNLHGFLELAIIGKKVGVNLWDLSSKDGRSIKAAFNYMIPYLTRKKKWEYQQIKSTKHAEETLISDLKYIKQEFKDPTFDTALEQVKRNSKH